MSSFAKDIGIRDTGPGINQFKKIFASYCAAHWSFGTAPKRPGYTQQKVSIVEAFNVWFPKDERQQILWDSVLYLNPRFVNSVIEHSVPLAKPAIHALKSSALALDVYCWLAHRLQREDVALAGSRGLFLTWATIKEQFGPNVDRMTNFRADFRRAMKMVLRCYPTARVDDEHHSRSGRPAGLRLHYSPPPVAKRLVAVPPMFVLLSTATLFEVSTRP